MDTSAPPTPDIIRHLTWKSDRLLWEERRDGVLVKFVCIEFAHVRSVQLAVCTDLTPSDEVMVWWDDGAITRFVVNPETTGATAASVVESIAGRIATTPEPSGVFGRRGIVAMRANLPDIEIVEQGH